MNSITVVGNVVADAEVRDVNGTNCITLRIGDNVGFGDKATTNWFKVSYFRKGDISKLLPLLLKGRQVYVTGEMKTSTYTDKQGVNQTSLEINANTVNLVGGSRQDDGAKASTPASTPAGAPAASPKTAAATPSAQSADADLF